MHSYQYFWPMNAQWHIAGGFKVSEFVLACDSTKDLHALLLSIRAFPFYNVKLQVILVQMF